MMSLPIHFNLRFLLPLSVALFHGLVLACLLRTPVQPSDLHVTPPIPVRVSLKSGNTDTPAHVRPAQPGATSPPVPFPRESRSVSPVTQPLSLPARASAQASAQASVQASAPLPAPSSDPMPVSQAIERSAVAGGASSSAPKPIERQTDSALHESAASAPRFDADYLSNPAPEYPALSRRLGEQGTVILNVRVSPDGVATQVQTQQTSGFARLDSAAQKAVASWRFIPATRAGVREEARVLVPIVFNLRQG